VPKDNWQNDCNECSLGLAESLERLVEDLKLGSLLRLLKGYVETSSFPPGGQRQEIS
jgi:hypothetical protein